MEANKSRRARGSAGGGDLLFGFRWHDTICINQSDDEEKESQVSMMGLVYQHAKIVYAWLGEEADGSAEAMGLLQILQTAISRGKFDQLHLGREADGYSHMIHATTESQLEAAREPMRLVKHRPRG